MIFRNCFSDCHILSQPVEVNIFHNGSPYPTL
jgi:hypothetical protein